MKIRVGTQGNCEGGGMMDWKQKHANDCDRALSHPLVKGVIDELMFNLKTDDALTRFGIVKVAMYAAQVARAQALGFDPELLRLTPNEGNEAMMRLAERAVKLGKPVTVIIP